eukprot:CAMPEP_0197045874 /NCGR_PEP_ID=MMETSP1384-20130603/21660_1 /TAXON_ID=29189 /ORGANISM="Ammonia sp." /LENGTH=283 /DNA_ID=CAMNT_0042477551 /DNA_START=24 /DNA_END=875 /DNA_ORIENTATION=+
MGTVQFCFEGNNCCFDGNNKKAKTCKPKVAKPHEFEQEGTGTSTVEEEHTADDKLPDPSNTEKADYSEFDLLSIAKEDVPLSGDEGDDELEAPLTEFTSLNTLRTEEKAVDPTRVQVLHAQVQESMQLGHQDAAKLIAEQYSMTPEPYDEYHYDAALFSEAESEVDAEERAEIQRRKTEELKNQKAMDSLKTGNTGKAKVFRPNTTTPWDEEDVHESMNEMSQHLEWMKRQHSSEKDVNAPESQLYRHKSAAKWAVEDLEQENKAMQQQLVHLLQTQDSNPKI